MLNSTSSFSGRAPRHLDRNRHFAVSIHPEPTTVEHCSMVTVERVFFAFAVRLFNFVSPMLNERMQAKIKVRATGIPFEELSVSS